MRKRFIVFWIVVVSCLSLLLCFPVPARAACDPGAYTFDISEGNITIQPGTNPGTFKVWYGNPQVALDNIDAAQPITIIGTSTTANGIMVNISAADYKTVYLTIDNLNIITDSVCPFSIETGSTVHLTLSGTNELWSTANHNGDRCFQGLYVPIGAVLYITSNSTGSLKATGSGNYNLGKETGRVGIGGGGTVTIGGGTVTATGGWAHTGISGDTVTISGGTVTATGGQGGGTGISGTVTISGGTVTAKGGLSDDKNNGGAGISGTVTINGGSVTAIGGNNAPLNGNEVGGVGIGGKVEISGGKVAAVGGISLEGDGVSGIDGTVTIKGGIISATGGKAGTALGNGDGISGIVKISSGMVTATGGVGSKRGRAGIRGTVTISGGTVVASGSDACIGSSTIGGIGIDGDNVTISNSTVIATGGTVLFGTAGAGIKGGMVVISDSAVTATGGIGTDSSAIDGIGIDGSTVIINNGSVKVSSIGTVVYNSNNEEVHLAVISGLPKSTAVSFTVNMASPTSYPTDTDGKLYLWLPKGSLTFRAVVGDIEYTASGEITNNDNYFIANYVHALSMVCNHMITTTGGSGSAASPYLAAIKVPNSQAALTKADLTTISEFTADLFSDGSFTTTTGSVSLTADASTIVYIRVITQDLATSFYYAVNVTRVSGGVSLYTFDISAGNIIVQPGINPGTLKVVYGNPQTAINNIASGQQIIIIGTSTNANTITVDIGVADYKAVCITLDGVNINNSMCPFSIRTGSTVHLTLSGTNTLSSGYKSPGLGVPQGAALDITNASTGSLMATGGTGAAGIGGRSGSTGITDIGGDSGSNGGTVTISGGMVTATGGDFAAGIGGGSGSNSGGSGGNGGTVTISGGTVTATGGVLGAGIGGGGVWGLSTIYNGGNGGTVTISGGMVTATSGIGFGISGAGIGGGSGGGDFGGSGAGIGGGGGGNLYGIGGNGGTVAISGGTVKAVGNSYGTGVLGTVTTSGCTVTISGGSVSASSIGTTVYNSIGTQEYPVKVTGLPANTAISYTVDGVSAVSCLADADGKLYLWLPATGVTTDIRITGAGGSRYLASITVQTADTNFVQALPAPEPVTTGVITGTVKDIGNSPISGAYVSLTVSGSVYSATTEADGSYSILNVPAGTGYTVTAGKPGYTGASVTGVNVTADTTTSGVNINLYSDQVGCLVTYKGAQTRYNEGSNTYDIRFIAVIDTLDAKEVGFVFSKIQSIPTRANATVKATTTVYTSITAAGSTVTAASLGGQYIIACTVTGIPASDIDVPLYVRAFSTVGTVTKYTLVTTVTVADLLD